MDFANADNISSLGQQIEAMYGRVVKLYQAVGSNAASPTELLPDALKELGIAAEKLQMMMQELVRRNEQLATSRKEVELEQQRYQHLFDAIPDGCLVTDATGKILEANPAAANLLKTQPRALLGRSLINLVPPEMRLFFQAKLSQLLQRQRLDFSARLQPVSSSTYLDVALTVYVVRHMITNEISLRWLVQDVTERKRAEAALEQPVYDPCHDRPATIYSKGEIIPLDPKTIWLVSAGVVKLTTLVDSGDEVMVGLAGKSMVFGRNLTTLPTYQAIALSDAHVVSLPHTEIAQSPRLAQVLLPLINQRLQQTERFLAIYGNIRVEDRLLNLLDLLRQEIGHPIDGGTRLNIRLTHQDLASACCTTRVTITRLLNRMQMQGKVAIDQQNHLILSA